MNHRGVLREESRLRPLLGLALVAVTAVAGVVALRGLADVGAHAESDRLVVTGFQSATDPLARIDASARSLSTVGVDGVDLTASGSSVALPDPAALAQLSRAHKHHLHVEFLVSNFSDAIDDFSEPLAWRLLGNADHRRAVAARLARVVLQQGWGGVNVDLESLTARDRPGLTDLLRRLRADLPRNRVLSVDVMADVHAAAYPGEGYDVRAISRIVDRIVLMTYDEHGPWEDTPGPVGSLTWTRACLAAFLADGGARRKIDLGVAGYGYAWRPYSNDTLTDAGARALLRRYHVHPTWNGAAAEWTATLPDTSVVWWSDARSYRARYAFAAAEHLHGVAVWSLGQSDPIPR